jgi:hypothetical protein
MKVEVAKLTPMERALQKIEVGLCWEWTGATTDKGYGRFWLNGKFVYPHRFIWEQLVGPIPDGYQLDHLCLNHRCANPDHLEPVPQRVNLERRVVKPPPGYFERNPV